MTTTDFRYFLLTRAVQDAQRPVNVIALADSTYIDAVVWDSKANSWDYHPEVASAFLYQPEKYDPPMVDRVTAEREATNFTDRPLPTEEELTRICRNGRAARMARQQK